MTQDAGVTLSQIGQIAINVDDLDRATAFYRDVLGMNFLFTVPTMAFFQCGDVRVMLGKMEQPEHQHPASIVYYQVADIEAAHETLHKRGVSFVQQPLMAHRDDRHELWLAFFHDSEENTVALMSEKPLG